jgi:hypothetical protein
LLGAAAVWYMGYWALSNSYYFISPTKVGFKDAFQAREVQFDELQTVTRDAGQNHNDLVFVCHTRTVRMPLDPIDESWFSALKTELQKRGMTVSSSVFGLRLKGE